MALGMVVLRLHLLIATWHVQEIQQVLLTSNRLFGMLRKSIEVCGAGNRLNVFWSGVQPPAVPVIVPSVGNWESLGCYR